MHTGQFIFHEAHEEVEDEIYFLHVEGVEGEKQVTIHQIGKCYEGLELVLAMQEQSAGHIGHALHVALVRSQHRISCK